MGNSCVDALDQFDESRLLAIGVTNEGYVETLQGSFEVDIV